jgi:hypothetical protein
MVSKVLTLQDLREQRQTARLLAMVRHLETASIDDALDLLITSNHDFSHHTGMTPGQFGLTSSG